MTSTRRLVVVRHAKSEWPAGVPDRARPLGPRGRGDAPGMGRRLRALVDTVDLALVSPAARTQQTWELLVGGLGPVREVRTEDRIYQAWGEDLADIVRTVPDSVATVLLLGHEPGVSELVLLLADRGAADLRRRVAAKFPTCAAAVLEHSSPWAQLPAGSAALAAFLTPKDASH